MSKWEVWAYVSIPHRDGRLTQRSPTLLPLLLLLLLLLMMLMLLLLLLMMMIAYLNTSLPKAPWLC